MYTGPTTFGAINLEKSYTLITNILLGSDHRLNIANVSQSLHNYSDI